jgi:Protein of unknown function (DUF3120)
LLNNAFNARINWQMLRVNHWQFFIGAAGLVSLPVFIEAPLVRELPTLTLVLTGLWVILGCLLYRQPRQQLWGELILGFSMSWFTGAIYWGWCRWEPLWHLPIESLGIPLVCWLLWKRTGLVASFFYLGSLLGTAATDGYIYGANLMTDWQQLMAAKPELAMPLVQNAVAKVQTVQGTVWAILIVSSLLSVGILALGRKQNHWHAFSGAVLTTILVDSLFLVVATITQSL